MFITEDIKMVTIIEINRKRQTVNGLITYERNHPRLFKNMARKEKKKCLNELT
jgi:hypothetical protein